MAGRGLWWDREPHRLLPSGTTIIPPGEPEGARSKMLQLQPSHHKDTINADVHTAYVEWRRIDFWTLTQSGLVAGPVGPSLLIMTLITRITSNCKVNSVI